MIKRRDFLKAVGAAAAATVVKRHPLTAESVNMIGEDFRFSSLAMEVRLSKNAPAFLGLNVDGLAKGRRGANIVNANPEPIGYRATVLANGNARRVEYRCASAAGNLPAGWTLEFTDKRIMLTSLWCAEYEPAPVVFHLELNQVHSTVLGLFGKDGLLATPALLHFPGQGSMRLTSSVPSIGLTYTSDRPKQSATLVLPGANIEHKRIEYALDVTAIYPNIPEIANDARFDSFRRNWLNALQLNPALQALANNTASGTCAFCYYEFADIAALTPPLAPGLTALDIVRETLERILAGGLAYGLPSMPDHPATSSDTYPALIIAAANCARADRSDKWLTAYYEEIRGWADAMLTTDTNGDGLIKYSVSGNSGIWTDGIPTVRPSNWWDTIGFGFEDAYANALAYRALQNMAMMASKLSKASDAARYDKAADKLRSAYYARFFDPATGVLAGWRSADGELHDYYFLFVSGIAIHYGLVPKPQANAIMDKLMAKIREVGYANFHLGLPGNLITVALKDYVHRLPDGRFGGGARPDNADGFQNYENGGATGAFAYFTLAALYDLGRNAEADQILFPMLDEYGRCGFEGRDAKGRSNDWRRWDGTPMGYEGFLTDDYYALFAVPLRQSEAKWSEGFRQAAAREFGLHS